MLIYKRRSLSLLNLCKVIAHKLFFPSVEHYSNSPTVTRIEQLTVENTKFHKKMYRITKLEFRLEYTVQ